MTLQAWLESALQAAMSPAPGCASAHLNEVGLGHATWEQAGESLAEVIDRLPSEWAGRLSLALPLRSTPALCILPPSDARAAADPREPPSIYLLGRGYLEVHPVDGEEFHASIQTPVAVRGNDVKSEFVSSRDAVSRARGWDFVNTIWIHFVSSAA